MSFPLAQTVGHAPFDGQTKDARGNLVDSWAAPVDVAVYGYAASSSHEPKIAGHDRVVVDVEVFAPPTFAPSPKDHLWVGGVEYEVIGETEDYNHGPFGWKPGNVVNLRRVTG